MSPKVASRGVGISGFDVIFDIHFVATLCKRAGSYLRRIESEASTINNMSAQWCVYTDAFVESFVSVIRGVRNYLSTNQCKLTVKNAGVVD